MRFRCTTCHEEHEGLPDLAVRAPVPWEELSAEERARRGRITSECCEIDGDQFFVRAVLEMPIVGVDDVFAYGVWVSLSPTNFKRFLELDGNDHGHGDGPWFGWLSVRLKGYPDTFCLKTDVHLHRHPDRPRVVLEPTDHPLAQEQRLGIRLARLYELIELSMHPEKSADDLRAYPYVRCGSHGEAHGAFVCGHLADGSAKEFFWADDPGDPWSDAWCERCDAIMMAAGGWTDSLMQDAGVKLICQHCYERIRSARIAPEPA